MNNSLTLLIVDDEATIRNGLSHEIPWKEHNITLLDTAMDGKEAFELIKAFEPDLVITDIKMPGWDGIRLIEEVKAIGLKSTFIILSGYDDFHYAQTAKLAN